jgi:hypothetical protein
LFSAGRIQPDYFELLRHCNRQTTEFIVAEEEEDEEEEEEGGGGEVE